MEPLKQTLAANWSWVFSAKEERIYHKEGERWMAYSKIPSRVRRIRSKKYRRCFQSESASPVDSVPITVTKNSNDASVSITGMGRFDDMEPHAEHPTSLSDALDQHVQADKWAVDKIDCGDGGRNVALAIINGTAKAISDGSFKDSMGTSASILYGNDPTSKITTVNGVPGNDDEQSAYRSELAGIEGTLAVVSSLCTVFDIQQGCITIGLDGDQALRQAGGDWPLEPGQACFDMIQDIRNKIQLLPIEVKWRWIRGHQDDEVDFADLDEWGQANCIADNYAKAYWNLLNSTGYSPKAQKFANGGVNGRGE
jgi:hypothetical protein